MENFESNYSPSRYEQMIGKTKPFSLGMSTGLGEGKLQIQTSKTPI